MQEKVPCMIQLDSLEPSSDLTLSHQTHIFTVKAFPVQFHLSEKFVYNNCEH